MKNYIIIASLIILSLSCGSPKEKEEHAIKLEAGTWRIEMDLNGKVLPFNFILLQKDGKYELAIINAGENIKVNDITRIGDSVFVKMPVFDSEFKAEIVNTKMIKGEWINHYYSSDYKIPFVARHGENYRFTLNKPPLKEDITGKYEVTFSPGKENEDKAIGVFKQNTKNPYKITGTFITETGDYRHLEGNYINDSLFLSTFDGAHAYLFEAKNVDGEIKGMFYSGKHHQEDWTAIKNASFELRNPYELTYLKEGYSKLEFNFLDLEGNTVSLSDAKYKNKVVIVQLMGSWCPNCMDETAYFSELHKKYREDGLEIIALAFERTDDHSKAIKLVKRLKLNFDAEYDFLLASYNKDAQVDSILPMFNHVMSFPTAIFIDKEGKVRQIHTGFYGPGTGDYYLRYKEKTDTYIRNLLEIDNPS